MKPWEETWDPHSLTFLGDAAVNDPRRDLASAAPDMARVLLALERTGVHGKYGLCCPMCNRLIAAQPTGEVGINHKPDCELDAALRKAGVR